MVKIFMVSKEVAHFNYKGKHYKPGDVVELPDNFPTASSTFLKPIGKVVPASKVAPAPAPSPMPTGEEPAKKGAASGR
jgi:hypothetical protein